MLGITTSQPVHWPPTSSPAVAPVTPVAAVAPAQGLLRDPSSSGFGSGRDSRAGVTPDSAQARQASADQGSPETQAAPLLPGKRAEDRQTGASTDVAETARTQKPAQEAQAQAEEQAAQLRHLQEVLTTVWKASAAVVDVALGRDAVAAAAPVGSGTPAAGDPSVASVPQALTDPLAASQGLPAVQQVPTDPLTYSDQGAGVWEAVETGAHLNQKA